MTVKEYLKRESIKRKYLFIQDRINILNVESDK